MARKKGRVGGAKKVGDTKQVGNQMTSLARAMSKAVAGAVKDIGQIMVKSFTRKAPPWSKKEKVRVRSYERKPPRWLWELWCKKYPAEARKRGLQCPPPLTGASQAEIGEALMATELIELGKAKTISRSGIQRAASRSACESAGGFWRERGGRTWMKKAGECMTPPSWLVEHWRNKGIEVTVLDGMCDLGDADACAMTGVAASGLGYFVKPGEGCPPGYKKVRTRHPLWKKGDFYMCVRPEAIPGLRARGLLSGLDGFWPTGGSPQNILFGVLTGSFANTFVGTALPKFIPTIADYAPFVSYGVSALTAIAHVFMGSDFSFGLFLGTLGPSIEALGRQLAELISPTAKAPAAMPAPTTTTPTTSGMGQPAPSEIERLRKKLRISFKPVAGTSNMGGNGNANGMGAAKVERPLKVF